MRESRRVFLAFFVFGLLNNILYVVILSAAIDLVGASTPKGVVLLADIVPSLSVKVLAPFFMHVVPYKLRIWILIGLSSAGMLIISLTDQNHITRKVSGITLASLSSGMGEVSFLQLTHYYNEKEAIGGFSSGTGGAGLLGSFLFMLLTNIIGMQTSTALLSFAVAPWGFAGAFFLLLPQLSSDQTYQTIDELESTLPTGPNTVLEIDASEVDLSTEFYPFEWKSHIKRTINLIRPLFWPYMVPLCTVYVAEYMINQGISPTLLFPLDEVPRWLIKSHRDTYVVYGFLYQLGVFVSRSSMTFGFRVRQLYLLSLLQVINVAITLIQSLFDIPFTSVWLLLVLVFYEGLLGGLLYVNTFMSVSEEVPKSRREFSMGTVGISDSCGIMIAGCVNLWLETRLCDLQVSRGRDWCKTGGASS